MALANFMPCAPQEAACIARLGTHRLGSWLDDSSLEEEDDDDGQVEEEGGELEEEDPTDLEEQGGTVIWQRGARARGDGLRGRPTEMMTITGMGVYNGRGKTPIIITELQGGVAYTTMQAHLHGTVASVKMIRFDTFDITGRVHQAIGRVRGNGHNAAEIVHKKAIGTPLAGVTPSLESITHCLEVALYVLDEIVDLAGAI